ncbi:MAG: TrkA family potassium uptake protein [Lachnospiraceae bacterium]|nr:TrkA family potassium uptake protein [Lachnospiraceae bacterium]MDD7148457.1 TrkA family potassium uptake protein [Lachnospiraceae bacterium]MDY4068310.1 TrkA family potassium uptake protein [Lachnospiraceae bacterium]
MKTALIIGMGKFGHHLCHRLVSLGNQVMIVDENEEALEDMVEEVTSAKIGDCTKEDVLKMLGVGNFDYCFVCIGNNFQSSLEITSLLKEMGAKHVISKAVRDIQAKFLLRNGADEVIYPDRDIAERLAVRCSVSNVFDYIELTKEYSIYEILPLKEWIGKSVMELNFRAVYHVNILGVKEGNHTNFMIPANHVFKEGEHLIVMGDNDDVFKILKRLN